MKGGSHSQLLCPPCRKGNLLTTPPQENCVIGGVGLKGQLFTWRLLLDEMEFDSVKSGRCNDAHREVLRAIGCLRE